MGHLYNPPTGGGSGTLTGITSGTIEVGAPVAGVIDIEAVGPFSALAYAATITPAQNTNNRIIATGNFTLALPTGTQDGGVCDCWITAQGGNRTVTLNAGYVIPSSSTLTSPFVVNSGSKTRFIAQYDATRGVWEVIQYIPGY